MFWWIAGIVIAGYCWTVVRAGALADRWRDASPLYDDCFADYRRHLFLCVFCHPPDSLCADGKALRKQALFRFSVRHRPDILSDDESRQLYADVTGRPAPW